MIKVAVYGSLKRGKYNHRGMDGCKFLGETKLKGTLYRVSSYPALLEEGDNEYDAEIYEMTEEQYRPIHNMEIGAGYKVGRVDDNIVFYADTRLAEHCKSRCEQIDSY
tara:strand:+ start:38887 stop:39210 length:324 start_codon:yes stop_codon:yes gene_type:complete